MISVPRLQGGALAFFFFSRLTMLKHGLFCHENSPRLKIWLSTSTACPLGPHLQRGWDSKLYYQHNIRYVGTLLQIFSNELIACNRIIHAIPAASVATRIFMFPVWNASMTRRLERVLRSAW